MADGTAGTAESVVWNVERVSRLRALGLAPRQCWTAPVRADVVADDTVDLVFDPSSAVVPEMLAEFYLLPPRYYATTPREVAGYRPRGSGPYAVEAWTAAGHLVLRRAQRAGADEATPEGVRWRAEPLSENRLATVIANQADVACDIDLEDIPRATAAGMVLVETESNGYLHGLFDQRAKWLSDRRVRQALNHLIDLGPLLKRFFEGRARALAGICNGSWENHQLAPYDHNPRRAHELLEAAGLSVRDGRVLDGTEQLFFRVLTTPRQLGAAQYVAGELHRNGIASSVTSVAPSEVSQVLRQGPNFGLIVGHVGGSATGAGELRWVDARFRPDLPPGVLSADPTFQKALDALAEIPALDALRERVDDLQREILEDAPWLFLYRLPRYTAHRPGLRGLVVLASGELLLDRVRVEA